MQLPHLGSEAHLWWFSASEAYPGTHISQVVGSFPSSLVRLIWGPTNLRWAPFPAPPLLSRPLLLSDRRSLSPTARPAFPSILAKVDLSHKLEMAKKMPKNILKKRSKKIFKIQYSCGHWYLAPALVIIRLRERVSALLASDVKVSQSVHSGK